MTQTRFTPGPWRVGKHGPNGCNAIGTNQGLMVAMVAHSINEPEQKEQAIGDSHLIAAAPLMYLLLDRRALLSDDDFSDFMAAIEDHDNEKMRDLWDRVQAKAQDI